MKKERDVIMIATDKESKLFTISSNNELISYYKPQQGDGINSINQHLYILSDEDIKEGDWYLANDANRINDKSIYVIRKCDKVTNGWLESNDNPGQGDNPDWSKKIIATTNSSLEYWRTAYTGIPPKKSKVKFPQEQLPQIPQSFIEYYIEQYNKGNVITKVMVEYEEYHGINRSIAEVYALQESDAGNDWQDAFDERLNELGKEYKLKLSDNNCIIIHNIEPILYTEEEVIELLELYGEYLWTNNTDTNGWTNNFKEWFETNKKK